MIKDALPVHGSNVVDQILEQIEGKEKEALKSIKIEKELVDFDLGNLLLVDNNPLDGQRLRSKKDAYLLKLAKENGQLLFNKLCELELKRVDGMTIAVLPGGKTKLPRSKPIPKPKPPTKWEQFSKEKGISKRKKEKLVWDDVAKEWKPRYGYKSIKSDKDQWIVEVPDSKDPMTDMFAEGKEEKKERIAKNEFQRLRNIARANKIKATGLPGVLPREGKLQETRAEVVNAAAIARISTASIGKFDKKLKDGLDKVEKLASMKAAKATGKKRKFDSNFDDISKEKTKYFSVLEKLGKAAPKVDVNQAVNNMVNQQHIANASKKVGKTEGKGRRGPKGKKAGKRVAFHNKAQQRKNQFGKGSNKTGSKGGKRRKGK